MFIPMIWLKWRKKLDADTDAKIQAAYLELNDANKAVINKATNKKSKPIASLRACFWGLCLRFWCMGLSLRTPRQSPAGQFWAQS